LVKGNV